MWEVSRFKLSRQPTIIKCTLGTDTETHDLPPLYRMYSIVGIGKVIKSNRRFVNLRTYLITLTYETREVLEEILF